MVKRSKPDSESDERLDRLKEDERMDDSSRRPSINAHYGVSDDDFMDAQERIFFKFYSRKGSKFSDILDEFFPDQSHEVRLKIHSYALAFMEFKGFKAGMKMIDSGDVSGDRTVNATVMMVDGRGRPSDE